MSGANANWPLNSCELCLYSTVQLYSGVKEKKNTACFYKDAQTDLLASATHNLLLIMHDMMHGMYVYFLCLILKLTNCAMIIKTAQLL